MDWKVFTLGIMRWEFCKSMEFSKIRNVGDPCFVGTRKMERLLATASIQQPHPPTGWWTCHPTWTGQNPPSPGSVAGQAHFRHTHPHSHTYCTQSTASLALREHYHFCSAFQLQAWKVAITAKDATRLAQSMSQTDGTADRRKQWLRTNCNKAIQKTLSIRKQK